MEQIEYFRFLLSTDFFKVIFALFAAIVFTRLLRFVGKKTGEGVSALFDDKDKN